MCAEELFVDFMERGEYARARIVIEVFVEFAEDQEFTDWIESHGGWVSWH